MESKEIFFVSLVFDKLFHASKLMNFFILSLTYSVLLTTEKKNENLSYDFSYNKDVFFLEIFT